MFDILFIIGLMLLSGWLATAMRDTDEQHLFWKGVGYFLLGNLIVNIGAVPIPVPQIIGAVLARRCQYNQRSRWVPWGIGLGVRLLGLLLG